MLRVWTVSEVKVCGTCVDGKRTWWADGGNERYNLPQEIPPKIPLRKPRIYFPLLHFSRQKVYIQCGEVQAITFKFNLNCFLKVHFNLSCLMLLIKNSLLNLRRVYVTVWCEKNDPIPIKKTEIPYKIWWSNLRCYSVFSRYSR